MELQRRGPNPHRARRQAPPVREGAVWILCLQGLHAAAAVWRPAAAEAGQVHRPRRHQEGELPQGKFLQGRRIWRPRRPKWRPDYLRPVTPGLGGGRPRVIHFLRLYIYFHSGINIICIAWVRNLSTICIVRLVPLFICVLRLCNNYTQNHNGDTRSAFTNSVLFIIMLYVYIYIYIYFLLIYLLLVDLNVYMDIASASVLDTSEWL